MEQSTVHPAAESCRCTIASWFIFSAPATSSVCQRRFPWPSVQVAWWGRRGSSHRHGRARRV